MAGPVAAGAGAASPVTGPRAGLSTSAARAVVEAARAAGHLRAEGWPRLLTRAQVLEDVLGPAHAPFTADDADAMPGDGAVAAEARALARAKPAIADGLRVLMLRGAMPFEGLGSWPLEAAFRRDEAEILRAAMPTTLPVVDRPPVIGPDGEMDYRGHLSVILKATRRCNLRCGYCSDWRADGAPIPLDIWVPAFRDILGSGRWSRIDMVWHGGEPTLLGRRGVVRLAMGQQCLARPGVAVANSMQTNGSTVTPRMAALLAALDFSVSVSLDGFDEVHDRRRPDRHGRGSYHRAVAGLDRLREAGLDPGVLVVVGQDLVARGADALLGGLAEIGVRRAGLLVERPAHGTEATTEPVPLRDFLDFLLEVHATRCDGCHPWIGIREIDEPLAALRGQTPSHCELLGNCQGAVVALEPDGRLSHCDKYLGDPDYILGETTSAALDGPRIADLKARDRTARAALTGCRWSSVCRGWCPHERHLQQRLTGQTPRCCGLAPLFEGLSAMEGAGRERARA